MPANLTPVYREAEAKFKAAVTREEKISALEEMLRVIPKHKGTEHLQADLRSRLSKLRQEPKKKTVAKGLSHKIPKEGAGQIALVGAPNSGKSSLVATLTHAKPEVAPYPLTTLKATPGMMAYHDVGFQLIDLPPLCHEHVEPWVYDLIRAADLAWLVVSVQSPLQGLELTEELLASKAIGLYPAGDPTPSTPRPGWTYKKTLLVVTGMDLPGAGGDLEALEERIQALNRVRRGVFSLGATRDAPTEAERIALFGLQDAVEEGVSRVNVILAGSYEDLREAVREARLSPVPDISMVYRVPGGSEDEGGPPPVPDTPQGVAGSAGAQRRR